LTSSIPMRLARYGFMWAAEGGQSAVNATVAKAVRSLKESWISIKNIKREGEMNVGDKGTHGGRRSGAGRPGGALNRLTRPVKELAADQGSASIERLIWLRDHAESEQVQFAATRELLDRGFGRSRQEIDVNADSSIRVIIQRDPPRPATVIDTLPAIEHCENHEDTDAR
jgi:hypothetical protein